MIDDPIAYVLDATEMTEGEPELLRATSAGLDALRSSAAREVMWLLAAEVDHVHDLLTEWRWIAGWLYQGDDVIRAYVREHAPGLDPEHVVSDRGLTILPDFDHERGICPAMSRDEFAARVDRAIERARDSLFA